MKLKNWVTITLLILAGLFILLLFKDNTLINILALTGEAFCLFTLTKYSKSCDEEE